MDFDPDKYLASTAPVAEFDPDKYLANRQPQENSAGKAPSGLLDEGSELRPKRADLFGDGGRLRYSFGDDKGRASYLESRGYQNIKNDEDGNVIAQGKDGKWYRDDDDLITTPGNYIETAVGKGLPFSGNIAGGLGGAAVGSVFGPVGTVVGGVVGAGLGSAAGEGVRSAIGKTIGTREEDTEGIAKEMALEGAIGSASELGAQFVAKKALPYLAKKLRLEKLLSAYRSAMKPNAEEIEKATASLPGSPKPTIGQIAASKQAQDLESTLYKSPTVGGDAARTTIDPVVQAMERAASDITSDASHADPYVSGKSAKDSIVNTVKGRLEPLKQSYKELEPFFEKAPPSERSLQEVKKVLNQLRQEPGMSDTEGLIGEIEKDLGKISSVQGIRDTITGLGRKLTGVSSANQKRVISIVRDALQRAKDNSINLATRSTEYDFSKMPSAAVMGEIEDKSILDSLEQKTVPTVTKELGNRKLIENKTVGGVEHVEPWVYRNRLDLEYGDGKDFLKKLSTIGADEPYVGGDTGNAAWRAMDKHMGKWNEPMPYPAKVTDLKGVLGKDVPQGGPDPFMWMDKKYGVTKKLLDNYSDKPLTINTRSDLITHEEYLNKLNPKLHKINIHTLGHNEEMNRVLEPGVPSFLRRLNTAKELKQRGFDVTIVQDIPVNAKGKPVFGWQDVGMAKYEGEQANGLRLVKQAKKGEIEGIPVKLNKVQLPESAMDRVKFATAVGPNRVYSRTEQEAILSKFSREGAAPSKEFMSDLEKYQQGKMSKGDFVEKLYNKHSEDGTNLGRDLEQVRTEAEDYFHERNRHSIHEDGYWIDSEGEDVDLYDNPKFMEMVNSDMVDYAERYGNDYRKYVQLNTSKGNIDPAIARGNTLEFPTKDVYGSVWDKLLEKKGKDGFTKIGNFNVNSIDGVAYVYDAAKTKQLAKIPEKDLMAWAQKNDDGSFYRFFKRNGLEPEKIVTKNPEISGKLAATDAGFAKTAKDIERALPFKVNPKQGVESQLVNSLETLPHEKVGAQVWDRNDLSSLQALKELDPEAFDTLRRQEIGRILKTSGVSKDGKVVPGSLIRQLSKYNEGALALLLGDEKAAMSKNLKTVVESMPQAINPSGTDVRGETRGFLGPILSPRENLGSIVNATRLKMMRPNSAPQKSILDNALVQKITKNPDLLNAVSNPQLRNLLERYGQKATAPLKEIAVGEDNNRRPQSLDTIEPLEESQQKFLRGR